jgi:hypothetical protein
VSLSNICCDVNPRVLHRYLLAGTTYHGYSFETSSSKAKVIHGKVLGGQPEYLSIEPNLIDSYPS